MKILLMEDDETLNEIISSMLFEKGYEVHSVYDGNEAEDIVFSENFDLLILDVNVPFVSGFDFLKNLRKENIRTPAIFITSLDDTQNLKEGFACGCDDYIKKPFQFEELELRIDNIRRLYKLDNNHIASINSSATYDFNTTTITHNSLEYKLTKKEIKVFEYLLKNKNRTVSIDELTLNVWNYDDRPSESTIRTYIKNFRKILGEEFITTVKGVGYRFN